MDWAARERALAETLAPLWPEALGAGFADGAADYGAPLAWTPAARDTADAVTARLAQDIVTMTATQRDRINTLVTQYSGDRAALVAALQAQDEYIASHAALIAADQTGRAYNSGKAVAAVAAGYSEQDPALDVSDGDSDADCAAAR
jgi:Spy/CpxP family protein refolding chaperone